MIIAYQIYDQLTGEYRFIIEPAMRTREWMDNIPNGFVYRCLPMTIANQLGWVIPCPVDFDVVWDGGNSLESTKINLPKGKEFWRSFILSHFGYGIITFSIPYLFRTPPGYGLIVRGATNYFKHGVSPLDGYVETDWIESTFTMNWKITEPNSSVQFKKGDPICMILPYKIADLENFETKYEMLSNNPELKEAFDRWSVNRGEFLKRKDIQANEWQKDYFKGVNMKGERQNSHLTKLKLRSFEESN